MTINNCQMYHSIAKQVTKPSVELGSKQIELLLAAMSIMALKDKSLQSLGEIAPSFNELVKVSEKVIEELGWGG